MKSTLEDYHLNTARHHLFEAIKHHDETCADAECTFRPNLLAWLAHCIGAGQDDVRRFKQYLLEYELRCQSGQCEDHDNGGSEGR